MLQICIQIYGISMTDQELHYRFALYGYIAFRLFLRVFIGKKRRYEFFNKKKIRVSTFFIYSNKIIKKNGIKAYIRRNSDDYELLFLPREQELLPHVKLQKNEIFLGGGSGTRNKGLIVSQKFHVLSPGTNCSINPHFRIAPSATDAATQPPSLTALKALLDPFATLPPLPSKWNG